MPHNDSRAIIANKSGSHPIEAEPFISLMPESPWAFGLF